MALGINVSFGPNHSNNGYVKDDAGRDGGAKAEGVTTGRWTTANRGPKKAEGVTTGQWTTSDAGKKPAQDDSDRISLSSESREKPKASKKEFLMNLDALKDSFGFDDQPAKSPSSGWLQVG
jgi:hypothetical protein